MRRRPYTRPSKWIPVRKSTFWTGSLKVGAMQPLRRAAAGAPLRRRPPVIVADDQRRSPRRPVELQQRDDVADAAAAVGERHGQAPDGGRLAAAVILRLRQYGAAVVAHRPVDSRHELAI